MSNCPIHNIAFFQGKYGPVHKTDDPNSPSGWCNGKEKRPPNAFNDSLGVPEAPTKADPAEKVDWDAKEKRMIRMNVLNRATEIVLANSPLQDIKDTLVQLDKITDALERLVYKKSAQNDPESSND